MSNELSKAIKRKTDAQFRTMGEDQTPGVVETAGGTVVINDPSAYMIPYIAGKNISIGTSGSNKVINAIMNIAPGANIEVSEPDLETGEVTISATIGGKEIDLTGLADGYVLTYDVASDSFILAELPDTLSQATETELGGVKAKARTTENAEVAIDETNGKLYAPESGGSYTLPQATETTLGGIKAKSKTTETVEVAIDAATGKLFAPAAGGETGGIPVATDTVLGGVLAKIKTDEATEVAVDGNGKLYVPSSSGGSGLPAGGLEGFYLKKNSSTDGDASWASPPIKLSSPGGIIQEGFESETFNIQTTTNSNLSRVSGGANGSNYCMQSTYGSSAADRLTIARTLLFPGKVSFYYKASFNYSGTNYLTYGGFKVTDNGVLKFHTATNQGVWTKVEFDISAGGHEIVFYREGRSGYLGQFWLDDVSLPANGVDGMDAILSNPDKLLVVDSTGQSVGFLPKSTFMENLSGATLPTADISYRGQIFTVLGDVGVADTSYICQKDATETYVWTQI